MISLSSLPSVFHQDKLGQLIVCISYPHEQDSLDWSSKPEIKPLPGESRVLRQMHGLHKLNYMLDYLH